MSKRESPGSEPRATPNSTPSEPDSTSPAAGEQDLLAQYSRRREAAHRSVPLDCGCRDPWICTCTEPRLSERDLDGWRDAALTVLKTDRLPVVPLYVRRALWRRPADRQLAELLHDACGGVAS